MCFWGWQGVGRRRPGYPLTAPKPNRKLLVGSVFNRIRLVARGIAMIAMAALPHDVVLTAVFMAGSCIGRMLQLAGRVLVWRGCRRRDSWRPQALVDLV